jgi:transcriptional regulator with XRE-family HTH domain
MLKKARKRRRLTQAELGRACGVTGRMVRAWENGESVPPTGRLAMLSRSLRLPVEKVLQAIGELQEAGASHPICRT